MTPKLGQRRTRDRLKLAPFSLALGVLYRFAGLFVAVIL